MRIFRRLSLALWWAGKWQSYTMGDKLSLYFHQFFTIHFVLSSSSVNFTESVYHSLWLISLIRQIKRKRVSQRAYGYLHQLSYIVFHLTATENQQFALINALISVDCGFPSQRKSEKKILITFYYHKISSRELLYLFTV